MATKLGRLEREQAYREAFLARLSQRLAVPVSEWPTVRCWTEPSLDRIFRQVRDELAAENVRSELPHSSLLEWLCRMHLASRIPVDCKTASYLIEIGASIKAEVDPIELLMAYRPKGIACYFSAVAFHALTTQLVEHHHVAELSPQRAGPESERTKKSTAQATARRSGTKRHTPRALGTLLFRFQEVPFYSTRRSARLVPGIQTRAYGPRAKIRITTLEQTLLDTLYKPFHCGGPEVVFEAWHEGISWQRIDEERLVAYLQAMNYPATARRLGVMLELVGYVPGAELRRFLDDCKGAIERMSPHACISLLPGVNYQNVNDPWLVYTP